MVMKPDKFLVQGFGYRFSALTKQKHNTFWTLSEQRTNKNVAAH